MRFQHAEDFTMAKSLPRRGEAYRARSAVYQVVGCERLNQCGLAIAARAKDRTLH